MREWEAYVRDGRLPRLLDLCREAQVEAERLRAEWGVAVDGAAMAQWCDLTKPDGMRRLHDLLRAPGAIYLVGERGATFLVPGSLRDLLATFAGLVADQIVRGARMAERPRGRDPYFEGKPDVPVVLTWEQSYYVFLALEASAALDLGAGTDAKIGEAYQALAVAQNAALAASVGADPAGGA